MKIITRDIINKNFTATGLYLDENLQIQTEFIDYETLIHKIDLAKTFLVKEKNAKPGQHVLISTHFWPNYLIWFFACAELGMKFIVSDFPKSKLAFEQLPVIGIADIIIYDMVYPPGFDDEKYKDGLFSSKVLDNYNPTELVTDIYAKEHEVILIGTSSGTTGVPKIIEHTHEFFYRNMHINADLYNLKESEKCWHNKNLQHGAVLGVFFLPTINRCATHFHAPFGMTLGQAEENIRAESIKKIQSEKIDRIIIFFNQIEWFYKELDINKKQSENMIIHYVGNNTTEYINKIVGRFGYTMIPTFGSTETGGPIFYTEITPHNYKNWNTKLFGKPTKFFKNVTTLDNGLLEVTDVYGQKIYTGDKFTVDSDGNFIFAGRENLCRVNGKNVYIDFLNSVIEDVAKIKHEIDFDLVFDDEKETFYIRTNTQLNLSDLNSKISQHADLRLYRISQQVIGTRKDFTIEGWKFSPAAIRLKVYESLQSQS
jgi:hypothetical protein